MYCLPNEATTFKKEIVGTQIQNFHIHISLYSPLIAYQRIRMHKTHLNSDFCVVYTSELLYLIYE